MNPVHVARRRVEFRDTDMAGMMHFSVYFTAMEEAEHEFLRALGASVLEQDGQENISWPRVAASCQYHSPLRFEDEFALQVHLERIGETSVTYRFDFLRDGELVAAGTTTAVCCRMGPEGSTRPTPIPPSLRDRFELARQ